MQRGRGSLNGRHDEASVNTHVRARMQRHTHTQTRADNTDSYSDDEGNYSDAMTMLAINSYHYGSDS